MDKAMHKITEAVTGKISNTEPRPGDLPPDAAPGTDEEFGARTAPGMSHNITQAVTGKTSNTDPRPEDLPLDAAPGTDEEFGAQAAMRHLSNPAAPQAQKGAAAGAGPTGHNGDRVEGVLLRFVQAP